MPAADTTAVNTHLIYESGLKQRYARSHSSYFRLVMKTLCYEVHQCYSKRPFSVVSFYIPVTEMFLLFNFKNLQQMVYNYTNCYKIQL